MRAPYRLWNRMPRMTLATDILPPRYRDPHASASAAWARSTAQTTRSSAGPSRSRCWPNGSRATSRCGSGSRARRWPRRGSRATRTCHDLRRRRAGGPAVHRHGVPRRRVARGPACAAGRRRHGRGARLARAGGARRSTPRTANGVVHRDVKPGNLLLDQRRRLHVADFGIASAAGLESLTMTGTVLGTAGYLAPEQARGERATPASDRYALAVVAFELLTGQRPFASECPTAEATAHVQAEVPSVRRRARPGASARRWRRIRRERFPTADRVRSGAPRAHSGTARDHSRPPRPGTDRRWPLIAAIVVAALARRSRPGGGPRPRRGRLDSRPARPAADDGSATSASRAAPPQPPPRRHRRHLRRRLRLRRAAASSSAPAGPGHRRRDRRVEPQRLCRR